MTNPVITGQLVALDVDYGADTASVISQLAVAVAQAGRASDAAQLAADASAREAKAGTGVPGQVAIPHCRSAAVSEPTLAFARLSRPVDFSGPDGDASLIFLIAAPAGGGKEHLKILSKLARWLVREEFLNTLRSANSREEVVSAVLGVINAAPATPAASTTTNPTRIVAVTACPTGIAHTYMAADALAQQAESREDVQLVVETQGSSAVTPVDQEIIDSADAVIFATDVGVKDRRRFAGKPVIESGVKRAINEPKAMIDEAIAASKNPHAHKVSGEAIPAEAEEEASCLGWGKRIQQAVMTGVSYMVPFVAAGGLLLALGYLIGGLGVADHWQAVAANFSLSNLPQPGDYTAADGSSFTLDGGGLGLYIGSLLFAIGQAGMQFIVPALSGYIAYALAGRPGIAPGFIGAVVSVTVGAGFIGGLVTGLLAGLVAMWIGSLQVPRWLASLMPVVIIPLVTSLMVGLSMYLLLGGPLAALMNAMVQGLSSMSGSSAVLLGIVIGLMMCFDLGGPVNKAAYLVGTAGLSAGTPESLQIMAAVMAAGMVPPIALSAATWVAPKLFTPAECENGKSAWLLGLSFVSEGAIPFAAADPFRVIPAMMLGGATTSALSMAFEVRSRAPHGGVFVIPTGAITPVWGYLVAILAGVLVAAAAVVSLKKFSPNETIRAAAEEPAQTSITA